jgi:hypothetical protein
MPWLLLVALLVGCGPQPPPPTASPTADESVAHIAFEGAPPGAVVVADGEETIRTPGELTVAPGEHHLRLIRYTYEDWLADVTVAPGQRLTLPVALVPLPAPDMINVIRATMGTEESSIDPFCSRPLASETDTFAFGDDIHAIVCVAPRTAYIRDLSFEARWVLEGYLGAVASPPERMTIPKARGQTDLRTCIAAAAADPEASGTQTTLTLLVDGERVQSFAFRVVPGGASSQSKCRPQPST